MASVHVWRSHVIACSTWYCGGRVPCARAWSNEPEIDSTTSVFLYINYYILFHCISIINQHMWHSPFHFYSLFNDTLLEHCDDVVNDVMSLCALVSHRVSASSWTCCRALNHRQCSCLNQLHDIEFKRMQCIAIVLRFWTESKCIDAWIDLSEDDIDLSMRPPSADV